MKNLFISLILVLFLTSHSQAASISFEWTPANDATILGLNIYQNDWGNKIAVLLPDTGEVTLDDVDMSDGNKHKFWATYENATEESGKSDTAEGWLPGSSVGVVGGFTVTVNVVPN